MLLQLVLLQLVLFGVAVGAVAGLALAAAGEELITLAEGGAGACACAGAVGDDVSVAGAITCGGAVVGADVGIAWGGVA